MKSYTLRTGAEHTPLSSVWKELLSKALAVGDLDPEPGWLWFLHFTPRHGRLGPERGFLPVAPPPSHPGPEWVRGNGDATSKDAQGATLVLTCLLL